MSKIMLNIPHHLPKEEATKRIQRLLSDLKEEQRDAISHVKEEWKEDECNFTFTAKGFNVSGTLQVNPDNIAITGKLPFALSFFKDRIADIIKGKAKALLAH